MGYKFNPFTGNLDEVGAGGGGGTPGGSPTQVQFNDSGSFGGDDGLTFNKTTNELTVGANTGDGGSAKVYGDINLDDGGASTTTVQCVTPTVNRTISFPDATGTVALVAGSNQAVQYNSAGANAGDSGLLYDATSGSLTVGGKTVTTSAPVINLSQTWNSAGTTFTGLKLNVTNTASASGSNLLDLQVGGTSQLSVTKTGSIRLAGQGGGSPRLIVDQYDHGLGSISGGSALLSGGSAKIWATGFGAGTSTLYFLSASSSSSAGAAALVYDTDAYTIAQRNGTNAQTFRLYNTWANNGVDFERTSITRDSGGLVIDAQKGGTGADPTNLLDLQVNGTSQFRVNQAGVILSNGDNIRVLGATSSANFQVSAPQNNNSAIQFSHSSTATSVGSIIGYVGRINSHYGFFDGSGGIQFVLPSGATDRFAFFGTTSAFPAIKRSSAELQVRLADDSAYTTIDAQHRLQGTAPASSGAAGTAGDIRYDANYVYVCIAQDTWARAALTPGPW